MDKEKNATVLNYMRGLHSCLGELIKQDINGIADRIFEAYENNSRIFIMGNGGSATTASHFASDLAIGASVHGRRHLRVTSLTDNVAMITSLANDIGYRFVFEQQLIGQVEEGDIVIGITASGNSINILKAVEFARNNGALIMGFIGFGGGKFEELTDKCIVLSSKDYGQVEDAHLCLVHIVSNLVRKRIANGFR